MELCEHEISLENSVSSGSGGGSASTQRWNPIKEQIDILENMYKQGIRNPSAEQIQEITTKLKVYGHVEGKNVFYWFQNHRARQRQKQKQDHRTAPESFTSFLHNSSCPLFPPPPCPNGCFFIFCFLFVCSPYHLGAGPVGFYPPKLYLPLGKKRSQVMAAHHNYTGKPNFWDHRETGDEMRSLNNQETLELFPTGILQEKITPNQSPDNSNVSTTPADTPSSSSNTAPCLNEQRPADQPRFFDLFSGNIGASFDQSR